MCHLINFKRYFQTYASIIFQLPHIGKPSGLLVVRCRILTIHGHEWGILSNPPTIRSFTLLYELLNQQPHCLGDLIQGNLCLIVD